MQTVYILPDHDEPGEKYAATVAEILASLEQAPKVKEVRLPDLRKSGDVVDWLKGWVSGWDGFGTTDAGLHEELQTKLRAELAKSASTSSGGHDDAGAIAGTWSKPRNIKPKIPSVKPMIPALIQGPFRD